MISSLEVKAKEPLKVFRVVMETEGRLRKNQEKKMIEKPIKQR